MSLAFQKVRVHNYLINLVRSAKFYVATYGSDGKISFSESSTAVPKTIVANEVTSDFDIDAVFHRSKRLSRTNWDWQLILGFDKEVILESFENLLMETHLHLAKDETNDLRQVELRLISAEYTHPPKHQASSGTIVTYSFSVTIGPQ
jgi:hypothetical protein